MRIALITGVFCACLGGLALAQAPKEAAPAGKADGKDAAKKAPPAMPVKVVAAKMAPAIDEAVAVGTLRADESITIRPEIAGRVVELKFNEGQAVARGSLLVKLDQAELAAVVASSRAQLKLETQKVDRSEDLHKKGFISQQGLDDQKTSLARARAKLAEDEARLAKTEMRASFAGVAGLRQVSEGQYVAAGTDIARLEKIDQLKLDFRVPESYLARLRAGQPVQVKVDAYAGETFNGNVYAIEPAVDEQTRTVVMRARVQNAGLKLRPGMFARVNVQLGSRDKAIWIPEAAIVPKGKDSFVFRVRDDKVEMLKVDTGVRKVGEVEIVKGVNAGDLVVTEGLQRIGPGSAVRVMTPEKEAKK